MADEIKGSKRTYSSISADVTSEEPEDPVEVQCSAEVEHERVASIVDSTNPEHEVGVDSEWWQRFTDPKREEAMPPVLRCWGGSHVVSQHAFDQLVQWYGLDASITVSYVVVGGGVAQHVTVAPDAQLGDVLDRSNVPRGEIWAADVKHMRAVAPGDLSRLTLRPLKRDTRIEALALSLDTKIIIEPPDVFAVGRMGLNNLGNTCFMNSSLQCLLHVEELVAYFLSGNYKTDVNQQNPIGCNGDIAEAFATLLRKVYGDRSSSLSPSAFRTTIGRYNRAFATYMQQDSQEFTVFLLDSLHEDLNRIRAKPATTKPELPDGTLATDEAAVAKLAYECWETHRKRNDSIIQDLFTGLYKSTVVCPVCSYVSVTFDPFFDLTLPLPGASGKWVHSVMFIPLQGRPVTFEVALAAHATLADLKAQVRELVTTDEELRVVDLFANRFYRYMPDQDSVAARIAADDVIVVYEAPEDSIPVYCRRNGQSFFGLPFYVRVSTNINELYDAVVKRFSSLHDKDNDDTAEASTDPAVLYLFDGAADSMSKFSITSSRQLYPAPTHTETPAGQSVRAGEEETGQDDDDNIANDNDEVSSSISSMSGPASMPSVSYSEAPANDSVLTPLDDVQDTSDEEFALDTATNTLVIDFGDSFTIAPAEPLENPAAVAAHAEVSSKHTISLDECLSKFAQPEVLGEQDEWYCSRCKEFRRAAKRMELWNVPDLFMIHLKRFSDFQSVRDKIADLVEFPVENWDLSNHIAGPSDDNKSPVYDLVAVDNHYGSLGGGHYTAYVHNTVGDNSWYYYDDSRVTDRDPNEAVSSAAYLLFYRRRGTSAVQEARAAIEQLRSDEMVKARAPPPPPARSLPSPKESDTSNDKWGHGNRLGGNAEATAVVPWTSGLSGFDAHDSGSDVEMADMELVPLGYTPNNETPPDSSG